MFCYHCGKQIPDGAKFCGRCGANISDLSASRIERPRTGELIIRRASTLAYAARSIKVFIDDREAGSIVDGGRLPFILAIGPHFVELRIGFRSIGSTQITVLENVSVNLVFTISSTSGRAVFESSGSASVSKTQSKNSGCLWAIIAIIVIAVVLWIVLPSLTVGLRFDIVPG